MTDLDDTKKIIYFDGVCNLCNASVQFVLKRNTKKNILFTSLQSDAGKAMLLQNNLENKNFSSFVFIDNEKIYLRSSAALQVAKYLRGAWLLLYIFIIVPKFIRDAVYNLIAKNRYKWFGKKEECWIPTKEIMDRFLV